MKFVVKPLARSFSPDLVLGEGVNSPNTSFKNWKGWRKRATGVEDVTNGSDVLSEDAEVIHLG